ncbi:MAG: T9SS type A sorting domain-containing protein [Calditrichaeota bacterium]|nr:T9SS type A sorting domain-containing protein [Calditrichota bacterium]
MTDGDASVTLTNCTVRLSDNDGLYIAGDDVALEMDACTISSHYGTGLNTSSDPGSTQITFEVTNCQFSAMGGSGAELGREGQYYTMSGNRYENITAPALLLRGAIRGESINEIFRNAGTGILFDNSTHTGGSYYNLYNCAIYDNATDGIRIADLDYQGMQQDENLKVRIRNCNLWSNDRDGLRVEGWDPDSYQDGEGNNIWPQTFDPENPTYMLELSYNIFGDNGGTGIDVTTATDDPPAIYEFNAFQNDGGINCDTSGCIADGADGVVVRLVSEASPFDFHFLWEGSNPTGEGINAFMNVNHDANWLDVGSSDVDCGIFGGPHGNSNRNEAGTATLESYVKLGSSGTGVMPWAVYYMFSDFTVAHVDAGTELMIEGNSSFIAKGQYCFKVNGTIVTNPEVGGMSNGTILFSHDGVGGAGWKGIRFYGNDNNAGSILEDLWVELTYSNFAGIDIRSSDDGDPIKLTDVYVDECGTGIYIYDSKVILTNVEVVGCTYENVLMSTNTPQDQVEVRGLISRNNDGTQTTSSGLRLYNSNPWIGLHDEEFETRIVNNGQFGMRCENSSPVMTSEDESLGNVDFMQNAAAQIQLRGTSDPLADDGLNNIVPPDESVWAVEFVSYTAGGWSAIGNWWGTNDPESIEDELFSNPALIDYSDWSQNYNANVQNLRTALRLMNRREYGEAIPYIKAVAEDESMRGRRHTALRYLHGCFEYVGQGYEDLRAYYAEFAAGCDDPALIFTAESEAIMTLHSEDRYRECLSALEARRERMECLSDSIENEKLIVTARIALGDADELNSAIDRDVGVYQLQEGFAALDDLLESEGNRPTSPALPSDFGFGSLFPNPFNSRISVRFYLPSEAVLDLAIYDITGKRIGIIASGRWPAGAHESTWSASGISAGMYFIRLSIPEVGSRTSRLVLIK